MYGRTRKAAPQQEAGHTPAPHTSQQATPQRPKSDRPSPSRPRTPAPIQPKLLLGPSHDPFEQEADRLAQAVAHGASAQAALTLRGPAGGLPAVAPGVEQAIRGAQGGGQPLAAGLRATMEGALGADFGAVRLHTDERAHSLNQALQARAFTTGPDIFFRRGSFASDGAAGHELLAHELTHVVQQGAAPTLATGESGAVQGSSGSAAVVQRNEDGDEDDTAELDQMIDELVPYLAEIEDDFLLDETYQGLVDEMDQEDRTRKDAALAPLQAVQETPTAYKTWAALRGMTLKALDAYTQTQADWHVSPHLTANERQQVWRVLSLARQEAILAGAGKFKVGDVAQLLTNVGNDAAVLETVTAYSQVVKSQKPFDLSLAPNPATAMQWGIDIKRLRTALGDVVLGAAMTDTQFQTLSKKRRATELIEYYQNSVPPPILQARGGKDIESFLRLSVDENKNPLDYNQGILKQQVRNYHRFEKAALDKLEVNYQDTAKKKPLTLILHSALDDTGAFHRDPNLTAVITNATMLTLMVEGKETLAEMQSALKPLAETYGMNAKIDQVMFAGHGDSRAMQLAGKVEEGGGKLKQVHDELDLTKAEQKEKADALFEEVIKFLDKETDVDNLQPHQRAIFNACLTNANIYQGKEGLNKDPETARAQIRTYLSQNPSLATYFQAFATDKGAKITSLGANASIGRIELLNPLTGNLDLISAADPSVTAPKITYVETGTDPGGVLHAVLELWADADALTQETLRQKMDERAKLGPSPDWSETIIRSAFRLILDRAFAAAPMIRFVSKIASTLAELPAQPDVGAGSLVSRFVGNNALAKTIMSWLLTDLEGTETWTQYVAPALGLYQVWMAADPTQANLVTAFLKRLAPLTCQRALKFVDVPLLRPRMAELLANPLQPGQLQLALLDILSKTPADASKQFLVALTVDDTFPKDLGVEKKLGGLATEDEILIAIGKKAKPLLNEIVAPNANARSNLALNGADRNTLSMQSITKQGKVSAAEGANLYAKPDRTSTLLAVLKPDTVVTVFGVAGEWLGIEYDDAGTMKSAFINRANVTLA